MTRGKVSETNRMSPLLIVAICGLCGSPLEEQQRFKHRLGEDHDEIYRLCNACWSTTCEGCRGYVQCSAPGRMRDPRALPCEWPYVTEVARCNL